MNDLLDTIARLAGGRQPFCLVQVVRSQGPVPRAAGAMMVVSEQGIEAGSIGGGALEERMRQEAVDAIRGNYSRFFDLDLDALGMNCGGRVQVLVQPVGVRYRLVVFGAGHVGRAIAELFHWQGFAVSVAEPRDTNGDLPEGVELLRQWDQAALEGLIDHDTFVIVATSTHKTDQAILKQVLPLKPRYLGMLSSPKKWDAIKKALQADGFDEDALRQVHAPVGLWIGAQTPREIAVSIAAQVISVIRRQSDE